MKKDETPMMANSDKNRCGCLPGMLKTDSIAVYVRTYNIIEIERVDGTKRTNLCRMHTPVCGTLPWWGRTIEHVWKRSQFSEWKFDTEG